MGRGPSFPAWVALFFGGRVVWVGLGGIVMVGCGVLRRPDYRRKCSLIRRTLHGGTAVLVFTYYGIDCRKETLDRLG